MKTANPSALPKCGSMACATATAYFVKKMHIIKASGTQLPGMKKSPELEL
jgi:hypothetical protein